ncbi:unnamed protein product [Oppiella nova]|uniref:Uncharacterized protein n=1 Tax=Oppiella nova TaxID=334625 RepID=A0A7R9M5T8_9ACAR|nr:unnamed protein product [Oppiella nova]CAG2170036.1 unnamed protein product [Oppiella nova]
MHRLCPQLRQRFVPFVTSFVNNSIDLESYAALDSRNSYKHIPDTIYPPDCRRLASQLTPRSPAFDPPRRPPAQALAHNSPSAPGRPLPHPLGNVCVIVGKHACLLRIRLCSAILFVTQSVSH